jgi:hypothetical protein
MPDARYFERRGSRALYVVADGCPLSERGRQPNASTFALHPKDFPVFLDAARVSANGEYAESDSYSVEENVGSDFRRRRMEVPVELVREAPAGCE